ncbi:hypothetical protein E1A91_A08G072300v1 [Gossypium mustelinum]|uniref:Uncharacterized protein n=1 Tax=Gossypium mustelinum TaxID=34275 RepID=A0A5D2Y669_GOSMU|nr:hypothetical protein E1A91_A08G072300v1 [Gossypium mustelinum]
MNPWLLNQGSKPSLHPKLLGLRVKESFLQNSRILSCRLRQQGHNGWKDGNRLKLLDKNVKAIQESHAQLRKDVDVVSRDSPPKTGPHIASQPTGSSIGSHKPVSIQFARFSGTG